ncbi:MAG: Dipeptide transport system permease protein DppC, partial [uncultured Nocardioidaceae bacterium]
EHQPAADQRRARSGDGRDARGGTRRRSVAGGLAATATQPDGDHGCCHHRVLRAGRGVRSAAGALRTGLGAVVGRRHPDHGPRPRRRPPARPRPLRLRPLHPAALRRPAVPGLRRGVDSHRPQRRGAAGRARRGPRRLGRHRRHAGGGHHAVGAQPAAGSQHRGRPRPERLLDHDRDRCRAGADLRPVAQGLDAGPGAHRLRARGERPRHPPPPDRDGAHAAQRDRPHDRAGDPESGHRDHRGGRAVLPGPGLLGPRRRGVGAHAGGRPGPVRGGPAARAAAGYGDRRHRAGVHPLRRGAPRGARPPEQEM